jgi:hypothetical protein
VTLDSVMVEEGRFLRRLPLGGVAPDGVESWLVPLVAATFHPLADRHALLAPGPV